MFTHTRFFEDATSEENVDYKKNIETLHAIHEKNGGEIIVELTEKIGNYIKDSTENKKELSFTSRNGSTIAVPFERTILLDMRAEKELEPADFDKFDAFVFGGILGDHPPQDRTKELRNEGFELRKLTKI